MDTTNVRRRNLDNASEVYIDDDDVYETDGYESEPPGFEPLYGDENDSEESDDEIPQSESGPGHVSMVFKCQQNLNEDGDFIDPITQENLDANKPILVTDDGYCFNSANLEEWWAVKRRPINPLTNEITDALRLTNCTVPQRYDTATNKMVDAR